MRDERGRFIGGGGSDGGTGTRAMGEEFDKTSSRADHLQMAVMNVGQGAAQAGMFVSQSTARLGEWNRAAMDAANEGERADSKLSAMMTKQGEGGRIDELSQAMSKLSMDAAMKDDDPLKEAAAGLEGFGVKADMIKGLMGGLIGQSRLYGNSLDSVSEAVGRAFGKGDVAGLTRIGVTLSDEQKARLKALDDAGASTTEKQTAMYQVLRESFDKYALSMTEGLSEAEIRANRLENRLDGINTTFGQGVNAAQQGMKGKMAGLLSGFEDHPEIVKGAGALAGYAQMAGTVAGPTLQAASSVAQLYMGYKALRGEGRGVKGMFGEVSDAAKGAAGSKRLLAEMTALDSEKEREKSGIARTEADAIGETEEAAKKATGAKKGLLDSTKALMGKQALNFGEGGALEKMGISGGRSVGQVGMGVAAGAAAGASIYDTYSSHENQAAMRAAGVNVTDDGAKIGGAVTGAVVGALAIAAPEFAIPIIAALATIKGAEFALDKFVFEPQERAAKLGSGADNSDMFGAGMDKRLETANKLGDYGQVQKIYEFMSKKSEASGDHASAQAFAIDASSAGKQADRSAHDRTSSEYLARIQSEAAPGAAAALQRAKLESSPQAMAAQQAQQQQWLNEQSARGQVPGYTPQTLTAQPQVTRNGGEFQLTFAPLRFSDPSAQKIEQAHQQAQNQIRRAYG